MAQITLEQQQALVLASARMRAAQAQAPLAGDPEGAIGAATAQEPNPAPKGTPVENVIASSLPGRFVLGAASPFIGAAQLHEHLSGNPGPIDRYIQHLEEMKQTPGFDVAGSAGAMMTPLGVGGKAVEGATLLGKVLRGVETGTGVGAATPVVNSEDFNATKTAQMGVGGATGGVLSGVVAAYKPVADFLRSTLGSTEGKAGRMIADLTGDKSQAVIDALLNSRSRVPGETLNAGQAAVPAKSPEFSALQEIVANRAPGKYLTGGIEGENEAARQALIAKHAGTPDAIAAAEAERTAATRPLRENALDNANLSAEKAGTLSTRLTQQQEAVVNALQDKGRFQTTAAQQEVRANNNFPVPGQPRVPPRYTENAQRVPEAQAAAADAATIEANRKAQAGLTQYQLDSLAQHGQFPLQAAPILATLDSSLARPGMRASDVVQKTLGAIKEKITSLTDENGVVNARDLYTIRKEAGNTIDTFAKETSNWDKKLTAGLQGQVQQAIDKAIEQAGGSGWSNYLRTYSEKSIPIENMETGAKLSAALREPLNVSERPAAFARSAADEKSPILNAQTQNAVDSVVSSLSRDALHDKLAREGAAATTRQIGAELPTLPSVGMFSPKVSVARAILNRFSDKGTDKVMDYLAENMDSPAKIAEILKQALPSGSEGIINSLLQRILPSAATTASSRLLGGNAYTEGH